MVSAVVLLRDDEIGVDVRGTTHDRLIRRIVPLDGDAHRTGVKARTRRNPLETLPIFLALFVLDVLHVPERKS